LLQRLRAAARPRVLVLLAALLVFLSGMHLLSGKKAQSSFEERVSQTLSGIQGAGKVSVIIQTRRSISEGGIYGTEKQEIPCGAVAVAQGADDPIVRQQLEQALCALLSLPASAVSIVTGG